MKSKNKTMTQRKFRYFIEKNPKVWSLFEEFTFDRINKGYSKYSADSILHRIRWETPAKTNGNDDYKINNNISSYMARRFIRIHPKYSNFFELRRQTTKG